MGPLLLDRRVEWTERTTGHRTGGTAAVEVMHSTATVTPAAECGSKHRAQANQPADTCRPDSK